MKETLRRAIARIEVKSADGELVARGTGVLVSPDLVLTARHVVADPQSDAPRPLGALIEVRFPDRRVEATLIDAWQDRSADWALLRCDGAPGCAPLPLGGTLTADDSWETYGFPRAYPDGRPLDGRVTAPRRAIGAADCIVLHSAFAATGNGDPSPGLAGAPVIVGGALVGVLRQSALPKGESVDGTLYACPIDLVVRAAGDELPALESIPGLPGVPPRPLPDEPFPRLLPYGPERAEVFFGRGRDIARLHELATGASVRTPQIIVLAGHSGVGKSSLLAAGLGPRLAWSHAFRYARRQPSLGLAGTLRETVGGDWREVEASERRPLVVALDRCEGAFESATEQSREEVAELVGELESIFGDRARRPRGRVILCTRSEWLADWHAAFSRAGLAIESYFLAPLGAESIAEVVAGLGSTERLREHYQVEIEPELPETIANRTLAEPESTVAPVLQVVLGELWDGAAEDDGAARRLTIERFWAAESRGFSLGDVLDRQLATLDPRQLASGLVLEVLAGYTTQEETPRRVSRATLHQVYRHIDPSELDALVDRLRELRLVAPVDGEQGEVLAHGTLAPLIRRRLAASELPGQRARRLLDHGGPRNEKELGLIERALEGMPAPDAAAQARIDACRAARDRARKRARAIRFAAIGAAVVVSVFAVTSWLGLQRTETERDAERVARLEADSARDRAFAARQAAAAREAAAESERQRALAAKQAAEKGRESAERDRDAAEQARALALAQTPGREQEAIASVVAAASRARASGEPASPAALRALLATERATRRSRVLWAPEGADTPRPSALALSAQGDRAAAGFADGSLLFFAEPRPDAGHRVALGDSAPVAIDFSPSGDAAVAQTMDGRAWVLDGATGEPRFSVDDVTSARLSDDGDWLVTLDALGVIGVWRVAKGEREHEWKAQVGTYLAAVPDGDGRAVAALRDDGSVRRIVISSGDDKERGTLGRPGAAAIASNGARALYAMDAVDDEGRPVSRLVLWNVLREKVTTERDCSGWERLRWAGDYALASCPGGRQDEPGPEVVVWNRAARRFGISGELVGVSREGARLLVRTGRDQVELLAMPAQQTLTVLENPGAAALVGLGDESDRVLEADAEGVIRLHDADAGWPPERFYQRALGSAFDVGSGRAVTVGRDRRLRVYEGQDAQPVQTCRLSQGMRSARLVMGGTQAAVWRERGPLEVWDLERCRALNTVLVPAADDAVVVSPDGHTFVGCAADGSGVFWDLDTNEARTPLTCPARYLGASRLVEGGGDGSGTLTLRDGSHGGRITELARAHGPLDLLRFDASAGRLLAPVGRGDDSALFDVTDGSRIVAIDGVASGPPGRALGPHFATVTRADGLVRTWRAPEGAFVHVFSAADMECGPQLSALSGPTGERAVVGCDAAGFEIRAADGGESLADLGGERLLAASADGARVALATSAGHRLAVWDVQSGERRFEVGPFSDWIDRGAFDPAGRVVAIQLGDALALLDARDGSELARASLGDHRAGAGSDYLPAFNASGDLLYDAHGVGPTFIAGPDAAVERLCSLTRGLPTWAAMAEACGANTP
ncbi:MAG: trypsin-like peptidase domain-containing protein [Deltaproteobacteria bacterium]|nr:trypsin-like peptidase domain-containing protein [Deltaproteobacteria bacterium]